MNKEHLSEISNRVKQCRMKMGLTQEVAAEKIGITYSAYTKIENGLVGFSIKTLLKIAEFYNLSLDFLIYGKDEGSRQERNFSDIQMIINLMDKESINDTINALEKIMKIIQQKNHYEESK